MFKNCFSFERGHSVIRGLHERYPLQYPNTRYASRSILTNCSSPSLFAKSRLPLTNFTALTVYYLGIKMCKDCDVVQHRPRIINRSNSFSSNSFDRDNGFNVQITVFSSQTIKKLTEESVIFNGIDLVASVGGYLGLYLGASILSIYQTTAEIGRRWFG